jgi:hypothetical protein
MTTAEHLRLDEANTGARPWKRWGPYLSERQWGTVREDFSDDGDAWSYFTHDQSRSRTYRWGEDGLAGISDDRSRVCLALALWNGADPILKERLFGLTNAEGNHGEDVKEYYFYLDSTPTHSWMRWLYKYPQAPFPYADLVDTNRNRSRDTYEYELLDTGVFDDDRYFDVELEVAKGGPDDLLLRITARNRGPDTAPLHVLPTIWFRNTWQADPTVAKPSLRRLDSSGGAAVVAVEHPKVGSYRWYVDGDPELLFTENESNRERLWGQPNDQPYVKDAFHRYVVDGETAAVNPAGTGTKAAAHVVLEVPAGESRSVLVRLVDASAAAPAPFADAAAVLAERKVEADAFYDALSPAAFSAEERNVYRQALAGMLWSKQHYVFDVDTWLKDRNAHPLRGGRPYPRNQGWYHMVNDDIVSMPDKWEYPWYAAWDLAFHTLPLGIVDPVFAREQLSLMLREVYLHPSGQIPAYEWNFGDVNPPVHAWATLFAYSADRADGGVLDVDFLVDSFKKLLMNFTWWVNRKDVGGRNLFEGGFLGLDNIGVFDRSKPLPTGGYLEQADGSAWMALFSQNMLEIALELDEVLPEYGDMVLKFLQHFLWIASAMDRIGDNADELWDEEDGFFYDLLRLPDGTAMRLKVRSMVGLLPMCAVSTLSEHSFGKHAELFERLRDLLGRNLDLLANCADPRTRGVANRHLLSPLNETKLRRVLARMLDEDRFFSPHGIRALSKWHGEHPYTFWVHGEAHTVAYEPAESTTPLFGGNSNWRGPVWMPVNLLILRALVTYYAYFGDDFRIECPTGSGNEMTLFEVAQELGRRLVSIFVPDSDGRRPVYGSTEKFQTDPHWKDLVLFYEYFHGDDGAGLGASHQTGWTGCVAWIMQLLANLEASDVLANGTRAFRRYVTR